MKACGPGLTNKIKCLFPATEMQMQMFLKNKSPFHTALETGPGHCERLSQPAVSVSAQKDLTICFQLGRVLFSGQKFGSQRILANILS